MQLGAVINGSDPGRTSDTKITLFDGSGVGLQDLAIAAAVIDLAVARGVSTDVDFRRPCGQVADVTLV